jgi:nucleoprotein TPR
LKDEVETLKTQKAEAEKLAAEREEQLSNLQSRVHKISSKLQTKSLFWQCSKAQLVEENLIKHRETNKRNTEVFKNRFGAFNNEKSELNSTISGLREEVKKLTVERDALRTTSAPDASQQLNPQLETLRQEKAALEQALAKEIAARAQAPAEGSADQAALIVCLY